MSFDNGMIGSYVIVRCREAGVHASVLEAHDGRQCVLTESRRLWYWVAAAGDFLSGVANHGLADNRNGRGSKIGAAVSRIHLTENSEIIACTEKAEASIRGFPVHNG